MNLGAIAFDLEIGDHVEIVNTVGWTTLGIGAKGTIQEKVVRFTEQGILLYYVLKGARDEYPIYCCKRWRPKDV